MGRWKKDSTEHKIKQELQGRFLKQERLTNDDIVKEYFEPTSVYTALVAKAKVKGIIGSIKKEYAKDLIPFGAVSEFGEFGVPNTKEEYEFMGIRRYKLVKGIIKGSKIIIRAGAKAGLITAGSKSEVIPVPAIEEGKGD